MTKTFCDHCGAKIEACREFDFKFKDANVSISYMIEPDISAHFCDSCLAHGLLHGELPPLAVPE